MQDLNTKWEHLMRSEFLFSGGGLFLFPITKLTKSLISAMEDLNVCQEQDTHQ